MYTYLIKVIKNGVKLDGKELKEGAVLTIESSDHCLERRCVPNGEITKCIEKQGHKISLVWNNSFEVSKL